MKYEKRITVLQTSFAKREDTIAYLEKHLPGITIDFITDSSLLPEIRAAGKPTQPVIRRMTLYAMAAEGAVPSGLLLRPRQGRDSGSSAGALANPARDSFFAMRSRDTCSRDDAERHGPSCPIFSSLFAAALMARTAGWVSRRSTETA